VLNISELLCKNAELCPDEIALIELGKSRSDSVQIAWKEFNDSANHVANMLDQKHIGRSDRLVHLMRNQTGKLENRKSG
jgi:acyl-CoA synthetase (AMP-forming)/AMP-acid ligase II